MAGKSVFIRQVAIITLMAQMGSFVPAEKAQISLVDRIFVRSGASDVITSGLSTFMVEMVETAHILHNATRNSLIIMDEIGRGTSTYDGISIAWAVAEYLATHYKMPPKTLFATHYHELQVLEDQHKKQIKNYHMAVENEGGEPVFLHTIIAGGASHSFGIAVAKLAGIPTEVVARASEILVRLESRNIDREQEVKTILIPQKETRDTNIIEKLVLTELIDLDIHTLTPLDALNKLAELKDKVKLVQPSSIDYSELEPQD
jgi:DNA mismatch repair protein MutS